MRPAIISFCSAAGLAIGSWAVPIVFPDVDPWVAECLLWLAGGLLLAAGVLWIWGLKRPDGSGTITTQTTRGQNSPIIANVGGDVNNYFGPAPAPPSMGGGYKLDGDALAGLGRALTGEVHIDQRRSARSSGRPGFPIWRAVHHVAGVVGDRDEHDSFPSARREIRQAAHDGRLEIWGRATVPLVYHSDTIQPKEIWEPIEPDYWANFRLDEMSVSEASQEHPHTKPEAHVRRGIHDRYWALYVDQRAIERIWRKPRNDGGGGLPPPTGPHSWMAR